MYNKILVPLDGSKLSECSLKHVKEVASSCRASQVVLLTALEQVSYISSWPASQAQAEQMGEDERRQQAQMHGKAEEYLTRVSQELIQDGLSVQTVVAEEVPGQGAADVILDYAKNNQIDLIIMSTHGRSGVTRWAIGSVADKVVRHAAAPVLTVAPEGCRIS
jgi:nucleotide-binding universal stress UspA family protein